MALFITMTSAYADMHMYIQQPSQEKSLNDDNLHIYFCGTGDPEIAMQNIRKPSCLAVMGDNEFFVIDTGEGASQNLGALGLPLEKLKHIFVTHWHSDHMSGIGYLNNGSWLAGRPSPLILHGPYGIETITSALNKLYSLDTLFRGINRQGLLDVNNSVIHSQLIKVPNTGAGNPVLKTHNITLSPFMVNHNPVYPALGYVIQYKTCKIVISGDTKIDSNLEDVSKNADLLINEAFSNYLGQVIQKNIETQPNSKIMIEYYKQTKQYHSDTLELAKMAQASSVKNLIITHLVPAIPTTQSAKDDFIKGMNKIYSGPIKVADDRDEVVINVQDGKCTINYNPAQQPNINIIQKIKS